MEQLAAFCQTRIYMPFLHEAFTRAIAIVHLACRNDTAAIMSSMERFQPLYIGAVPTAVSLERFQPLFRWSDSKACFNRFHWSGANRWFQSLVFFEFWKRYTFLHCRLLERSQELGRERLGDAMAANGQFFQDAQSQQETQYVQETQHVQETQAYDSEPVQEIASDSGHLDDEVPDTQPQDSLVAADPTPATLAPKEPEDAGPMAEGCSEISVEGTSWQQLREMSHKSDQYCKTCKGHRDAAPEKRVTKKGHAGWQCRVCHNVTTILYRRMDMKNLSYWKDLTDHQVTAFFQKAGKCASLGNRMDFRKIQGALIDTCSESEVHRHETAVKGKFLPLSVWASKGYDTVPIEANAEWRKSDLFGYVYKVPVLQINLKHIQEEVRSRVLQATRAVGRSILANIFMKRVQPLRSHWSGANRYFIGAVSTAIIKWSGSNRYNWSGSNRCFIGAVPTAISLERFQPL